MTGQPSRTGLADGALDQLRAALRATETAGERYELVREIGRGGMGVVYLARDRELEREVALKVLAAPLATSEAAEGLRREARIAAGLEHPGIVPVYDVGLLPDGRPFYVMKHVHGARLDEIVRSPMPLRAKLEVFLRLCEALAYAHAQGVVHRDLKPENVRVGGFGEVLVLDFGIARRIEDVAHAGSIAGTPGWMAPEQARGEAELDARADVYSLGALLHALSAPAPAALRAISAKAMSERRDERYRTAEELAAEVRRFLAEEPVLALPETPLRRIARLARRHRVALVLLGAYLAVRVTLFFLSRP